MNSPTTEEPKCPACKSAKNLKYLWPSTQKPACVEANIARFRRCDWCGWTGDILTGTEYHIERMGVAGYFINRRFWSSLENWLESLGLCP